MTDFYDRRRGEGRAGAMGGGNRRAKEARRASKINPLAASGAGGDVGGSGSLSLTICEREQLLAIRLVSGAALQVGSSVEVVRGMPLAVVSTGKVVGTVSDRRQEATLSGCLEAGYRIVGTVTVLEAGADDALASVSGVRSVR